MRNLFAVIVTALLGLTLAGLYHGRSIATDEVITVARAMPQADSTLTALGKYNEWTLVNPEPVLMDPQTAALCARASGQSTNPHADKYISVYVNDSGREPMMTRREPVFPVGTMIVKEKLAYKDSKGAELLTAMIKHEQGYFPEGGDWEYLLLDGTASKVVERGKLDRCNSCHMLYKNRDFVTRLYLPRDIAKELK